MKKLIYLLLLVSSVAIAQTAVEQTIASDASITVPATEVPTTDVPVAAPAAEVTEQAPVAEQIPEVMPAPEPVKLEEVKVSDDVLALESKNKAAAELSKPKPIVVEEVEEVAVNQPTTFELQFDDELDLDLDDEELDQL